METLLSSAPGAVPFKIGLGFSGGGYRAASFCLGILTMLEEVQMDGEPLLKKACALSTVSGGTITGARYALGIKDKESMQAIYTALCGFMLETDLPELCLDKLGNDQLWEKRVRSLINATADVYNEHLTGRKKFGELFDEAERPIHFKHMAFNSTEFCHAQPFRFQWSEKLLNPTTGKHERGIIGNYYISIPEEIAARLRMADIVAASSCFPGGFEPINFPGDFLAEEEITDRTLRGTPYPVGLMDGGIVDNQGIGSLILADSRMKKAQPPGMDGHALDLVIICDVASPYMEKYVSSKQQKMNWWRRLTPKALLTINTVVLVASLILLWWSYTRQSVVWGMVAGGIFSVSAVVYLLVWLLRITMRKMHIPDVFRKPLGKLLKLKLLTYENLVANRFHSALKLMNDVFLKRMRKLNYDSLYNDRTWENRRIMNAIYELRPCEPKIQEKIKKGELPGYLHPTEQMGAVATKAASMATTLWFTGTVTERKDMMEAIIATGQFTMCWNLLEYIEKIQKNDANTNNGHKALLSCKPQLEKYWQQFKDDPFWLVKKYSTNA